jgi:hypothetical protein
MRTEKLYTNNANPLRMRLKRATSNDEGVRPIFYLNSLSRRGIAPRNRYRIFNRKKMYG